MIHASFIAKLSTQQLPLLFDNLCILQDVFLKESNSDKTPEVLSKKVILQLQFDFTALLSESAITSTNQAQITTSLSEFLEKESLSSSAGTQLWLATLCDVFANLALNSIPITKKPMIWGHFRKELDQKLDELDSTFVLKSSKRAIMKIFLELMGELVNLNQSDTTRKIHQFLSLTRKAEYLLSSQNNFNSTINIPSAFFAGIGFSIEPISNSQKWNSNVKGELQKTIVIQRILNIINQCPELEQAFDDKLYCQHRQPLDEKQVNRVNKLIEAVEQDFAKCQIVKKTHFSHSQMSYTQQFGSLRLQRTQSLKDLRKARVTAKNAPEDSRGLTSALSRKSTSSLLAQYNLIMQDTDAFFRNNETLQTTKRKKRKE